MNTPINQLGAATTSGAGGDATVEPSKVASDNRSKIDGNMTSKFKPTDSFTRGGDDRSDDDRRSPRQQAHKGHRGYHSRTGPGLRNVDNSKEKPKPPMPKEPAPPYMSSEPSVLIEDCFDRGLSLQDTLKELGKIGDIPTEKLCLEIMKQRELKKQARFKRFGSVAHLREGWTKADLFAEQWAKGQRPTPNVSWHIERDGTIEERLNAPLPVSRERPVMKSPDQAMGPPKLGWGAMSIQERLDSSLPVSAESEQGKFSVLDTRQRGGGFGARGRGRPYMRGRPAYMNSTWVNPELDDDNVSTYTFSNQSVTSSTIYRIDRGEEAG